MYYHRRSKPLHRLSPSGVARRDVEYWSSPNARARTTIIQITHIHTYTFIHTSAELVLCAPSHPANKGTTNPHVDRFTYSKPLVVENFLDGDPMIYVGREHSLYEVFRRLTDGIPEWCLHLQIQLNRNYLPRTRRIPLPEWYERFESVIKIFESLVFHLD